MPFYIKVYDPIRDKKKWVVYADNLTEAEVKEIKKELQKIKLPFVVFEK